MFYGYPPYPTKKSYRASVTRLHDEGTTLAIASGKSRRVLLQMMKDFDLLPLTGTIVCDDDVTHKKPAPDMALKVLSLTDTLPAEAIVVGDTTCGVTYGNHNRDILKSSRADFLIDNFSQLYPLVFTK